MRRFRPSLLVKQGGCTKEEIQDEIRAEVGEGLVTIGMLIEEMGRKQGEESEQQRRLIEEILAAGE